MSRSITILINAIFECLILGSSTEDEALKCYNCNSGTHSWCEDKDDLEDAGVNTYKECSSGEKACIFAKTSKPFKWWYIQNNFNGHLSIKIIIVRIV